MRMFLGREKFSTAIAKPDPCLANVIITMKLQSMFIVKMAIARVTKNGRLMWFRSEFDRLAGFAKPSVAGVGSEIIVVEVFVAAITKIRFL